MNSEFSLTFEKVSKAYDSSVGEPLMALSNVSFQIPSGRKIAIVGRSGSGKSTLLHLSAGIDLPTEGIVRVEGRDLADETEQSRTILRRNRIGLVFQFFYLLPHLSVRDNVALPELIAGSPAEQFNDRLDWLLERVGLANRAQDTIERLSGGEMQRIAICRALIRKPKIVLADEPTGNLDDATARTVMELMLEMATEEKSTLVFVTHSREMASLADETWSIHSGLLEEG